MRILDRPIFFLTTHELTIQEFPHHYQRNCSSQAINSVLVGGDFFYYSGRCSTVVWDSSKDITGLHWSQFNYIVLLYDVRSKYHLSKYYIILPLLFGWINSCLEGFSNINHMAFRLDRYIPWYTTISPDIRTARAALQVAPSITRVRSDIIKLVQVIQRQRHTRHPGNKVSRWYHKDSYKMIVEWIAYFYWGPWVIPHIENISE